MDYELAPNVSFGIVDDRAVVLDLSHDRYQALGPNLTLALTSLGHGNVDPVSERSRDKLYAAGLTIKAEVGVNPPPIVLPRPMASAIEIATVPGSLSFGCSSVLMALLRTRASLELRGMPRTIERARAVRAGLRFTADLKRAVELGQAFHRHQTASPFARSCVPNALALSHFLTTHGIDHDLIFGVRLDPFSAHAWV
jgi:hypothetical protein